MARPPTLLFWVQHLLGIGHLMRSSLIAGACAERGWDVHLVSGGMPLPTLEVGGETIHQLPPVRAADESFKTLLDERDRPVTEAWRQARRARLLDIFARVRPDAVLTEHFPFGRRQFDFELVPLLEAAERAQRRPLIAASVRDVLVARTAKRGAEAAGFVADRYDAVLVHSDPRLIRLKHSMPAAAAIGHKLHYTGLVGGARAPVRDGADGRDEIVVSAGGGAVGIRLIETALAAARRLGPVRRWRVLVGGNVPERIFAAWRDEAAGHVTVERARPDFRDLLARAALSISQAGYNTAVDILAARVRAILVPFATAKETEQTLRAERLAHKGLAHHLPEAALTPDSLGDAAIAMLKAKAPEHDFRLDGEIESERLLRRLLDAHRGRAAA